MCFVYMFVAYMGKRPYGPSPGPSQRTRFVVQIACPVKDIPYLNNMTSLSSGMHLLTKELQLLMCQKGTIACHLASLRIS